MCCQEFRVKALPAEDPYKDSERGKHREADFTVNDIHSPQNEAAEQHACCGASDNIIWDTEEHFRHVDRFAFQQHGNRRCGGNTINRIVGHKRAERDQKETSCGKRRVYEVFSKAAESALHNQDGKHGTENRNEKGNAGRKCQGKHQSGDHCAAVEPGVRLFSEVIEDELRQYCRCDGTENHIKRVEAIHRNTDNRRREEGENDRVHNELGRPSVSHMRHRGDIQCIIHFFPPASARFCASISAFVRIKVCVRGLLAGQI